MPSATATSPGTFQVRPPERRERSYKFLIAIALVAGVIICANALGRKWPFAETPVLQNLREVSDSQVEVRSFYQTYFPHPGCVLEGLVFHRGPADAKPLITIEKVTIQGSYLGLFSQHVSRIIAERMLVTIPAFGTGEPFHTTPSKITVDEIVANGAAVEFVSHNPERQPLRFDVHQSVFRNVGWSGPLSYRMKVRNPEPPGEVEVQGKFGVWKKGNAGETPISGEYKFEHADLSVYHGIGGMLSSAGKFAGELAHIDISGTTDTPDFEVKSGSHPVRLTTQFNAYVDATRGDTFLKQVSANFWKTHIEAVGSIAKSPAGKGKTALIDLRSNNARIEDILRLFVKENRPPMSGSVALQGRAEIPPGQEEFLKKVKLRGSFGIDSGTFSKPSTQEGVNKLSAGARGEQDRDDPETVLTDLRGQVNLLGGTATFSDLSFGVPGASARMHGTYNLLNHKVDLHGQMQVDSKISNTETGAKAFLLKMMEPFFKKKKKGEIVPVRISGTYEHPGFGLDLNDKKAQKVPDPAPMPSKNVPPSPRN
jgi:hypothetical protein